MKAPAPTSYSRLSVRALALLAVLGLFSMLLGPVLVVRADDIRDDLDAGVGSMSLIANGAAGTTNYVVLPRGSDGKQGCNLTGGTSLAVSVMSSDNSVATVSPNSITFSSCGDAPQVTVSPHAQGSATISLTMTSNSTGGTFNLVPATFTVNVAPAANTEPTLTLPDDITGVEATGPDGAEVSYSGVSGYDAEDGALSPSCSAESGSTYPLGTTIVECTVTDSQGAQATGGFSITVVDTAGPVLTLPANTTEEASSASGAVVTYSASAADAVDGDRSVSCNQTSGSVFPIGTVNVECSASDKTGNSSSGSFSVTVQDGTAPVLTVPASAVLQEATSASGATVPYPADLSATDAVTADPTITCRAGSTGGAIMHFGASGDTFPIGTTTLYCRAIDEAGNKSGAQSFDVIVVDSTAPVVTAPADITNAEATGPSGAVVNYNGESALDSVDGPLTADCTPTSGSIFELGTTVVTCSATDSADNIGSASFSITVTDSTAPVLALPLDITEEATSEDGAVVSFTATAEDVVDGAVVVDCTSASADTFPLGTTTVTCSASDARGNSASGTFTVTVQDTTAPAVTVPEDQTVEATGPSGAVVAYIGASASDLVDGSLEPTCSPSAGSTFAIGATTVTCTAIDARGNTGSNSFTVTVVDSTPPAISVPAYMIIEATGATGATVNFSATATDLVDGNIEPVCDPAPGSTFALGTVIVTCSVTDLHGNNASESFSVTVQDTTEPVLELPEAITWEATGADGATVEFSATASDLVDGSVAVTCSPASGSTFSIDTTTVNCDATDAHGNTGSGSFTVTVQDTTGPAVTVPTDITVDPTGVSGAIVTYGGVSANDLVDGMVNLSCSPVSGSVFAIGGTTVTCSATDTRGNSGSKSFKVTVKPLTIVGFVSPVDMSGTLNTIKGGSTVPLKFKIYAGTTDISGTVSASSITFSAMKANCTTGATEDAIEEFSTTGGTSLRYDATARQWIQNWQTPKLAGTCYSVKVTVVNAGAPTIALFKLK